MLRQRDWPSTVARSGASSRPLGLAIGIGRPWPCFCSRQHLAINNGFQVALSHDQGPWQACFDSDRGGRRALELELPDDSFDFRHDGSGHLSRCSRAGCWVSGGQSPAMEPGGIGALGWNRTLCPGVSFRSIETLQRTSAVLGAAKQGQFFQEQLDRAGSPRATSSSPAASSCAGLFAGRDPRPAGCGLIQHSSEPHRLGILQGADLARL